MEKNVPFYEHCKVKRQSRTKPYVAHTAGAYIARLL